MDKYIAIDSGKYATKVASFDARNNKTTLQKFRTKISAGNFNDDALEACTIIVEFNGNVYKIGNGAIQEAELNTSKASEIHKLCVLTAIAMNVSDNETDEVHAAVGIPVKEWENVDKRMEYKNFILPDGLIEMKLMFKSDSKPVIRKFKIKSKHVYPESQGALFIDDVIPNSTDTIGVID